MGGYWVCPSDAEEDTTFVMAERILPAMECRREGYTHGQNLCGRGVERLGVDNDTTNPNGVGGKDLGEKWLCLENSTEEARGSTCLEGELISTLLFEHGGRQTANPLWVVCILLGRLF